MKKLVNFLILGLLLALACQRATAQTIRRVNNTGLTGPNIYADLPAAYTASAAGDIIQVEPSGTAYTGIIVNKNVTIVGPGYFLDPTTQNSGLQANPLTATVARIAVQAGGASAYIAGLTVGDYSVEASNVTVQRCFIYDRLVPNGTGQDGVTAQGLTGVTIKQCYISHYILYGSGQAVDNLTFVNNIINTDNTAGQALPANYNGGFFNNVVIVQSGGFKISNFFVTNNYFDGTGIQVQGNGNTLSNNISARNDLPAGSGNQTGISQAQVFTLAPGSTAFDGWYVLRTGTNPAKGGGVGGTDVGAFSVYNTGTPYKLGGLPNIPAIYQQSQSITGNALNVSLSTRANN